MRVLLCALGLLVCVTPMLADDTAGDSSESARIEQGLELAPLPLRYEASQRDLVGLGSYLINAVGACADCHSPSFNPYAEGGNPYRGEPRRIDGDKYMIGGADMEGFVSRNLRPDARGRPAGLTLEQFLEVMRTGKDFKPDLGPPDTPTLMFMTWPYYMHMTDRDLRAMYAYLAALPPAGGGKQDE